ncbi:MAG: radical SAM protein [Candidatus Omnitrophica bacterium]|nr:radical SAM protein [Candidatus Omnitrophota bacterium]MBU4418810.1 radical SAM protein [Candidatus Omnitrophota bacterium]MBU4467729.1 radical SAM protein [Candidatus Omnitrophota bacterium]MCG2707039.1 radical SAM protein [Candidatus Omnitrophota bacterium]
MMNPSLDYNFVPKVCAIQVVNTCFMKCKMCYSWQRKEVSRGLSIEEWEVFIISLKEILPSGTPICFTGSGEPLGREGVLELIAAANKNGFIAQLATNGYLIDENMAKRLADAALYGISVSLDSLNEQTHDFLRGIQGTFARVMQAIGYLRKNKIGFSFNTIIMEKNLNDILDLVRWSTQEGIGVRFQAIVKPFDKDLDDYWYKNVEWKSLWPQDINKAIEIVDELIKLKQSGYRILNPLGQLKIFKDYFTDPEKPCRSRICNIGDYLMNMDLFGNVHPCSAIGIWGNIKEQHIRDIWFSKKAQEIREKIRCCQKPCHHLLNCFFE